MRSRSALTWSLLCCSSLLFFSCNDGSDDDSPPVDTPTPADTPTAPPVDTPTDTPVDTPTDTPAGTPTPVREDADGDGYSLEEGDCDDEDDSIHPGATEQPYDGIDQDCAGGDLTDRDGDGYDGGPDGDDCDDTDDITYPDADEAPDRKDNDCDGQIDEGLDTTDDDGDGTAEADGDCDDEDDSIHPDAPEEPYDGIDQDCDGGDLTDVDGDGIDGGPDGEDCRDDDETISPLATEVAYDGIDQDCDGDDLTDVDGDGYDGLEAGGTDCDDADPNTWPGAGEFADNRDNDCDGRIDEGLDTTDDDGDGASEAEGDCNDDDASIHPGATETCDGIDNDCEGGVDEEVQSTFHPDADRDGYGDGTRPLEACAAPEGYVTDGTDCQDTDDTIHPSALEVCNGVDEDCDGEVDDGALSTWYSDSDQDGYGDPDNGLEACVSPDGHVADNTDCDDDSASIHPAASEVCNTLDDDCDGAADEGVQTPYFADDDSDGYGDPDELTPGCSAPTGHVADNTDCDDGEAATHPGATEVCDGIDQDCDLEIDEEVLSTFYRDADQDGFGNAASSQQACTAPKGYVADATDCRDTNDLVHPGALETCNGVDDDCDGTIDDGVKTSYYLDADRDRYGDPDEPLEACTQPAGYVTDSTDCDDGAASTHPNATEVCNDVDDDCDLEVDEGLKKSYYRDADGDRYGNDAVATQACAAPEGYVTDSTDCDDGAASTHPNATEVCNDVDDDCDLEVDEGLKKSYYRDADGDRYGNDAVATQACAAPEGYVTDSTDCDDGAASTHPNATEICNDVDDDCDLEVDEGLKKAWYLDADSDTYGVDGSVKEACAAPAGYANRGGDCNDSNPDINPGRSEALNGIDDDCDGQADDGAYASSCNSLKQTLPATPSGTYTIDTDGAGPKTPVTVYCDMTTDGGGWTYFVYQDLIAYWSFDDASPTTADYGSYTGALTSTAKQTSAVPFAGFGKSINFDNTESSRLDLSTGVTLPAASSVSFWAQHVTCENNQIPILFNDNASFMADLRFDGALYHGSATQYVFHTSTDKCSSYINTWAHHVYIDTGSELRVYRNGERVSPATYSYRTIKNFVINRFGSRPGFGTNGLGGNFDDAAVFGRALTAEEVKTIYTEGKTNGRGLRWK